MKRSIVENNYENVKTHVESIKKEIEMLKEHSNPNLRSRQQKLMRRKCSNDEHYSFFDSI